MEQRPITMNYMGASMKPTLSPGDGLKVVPYKHEKIRKGDVVVFLPHGKEDYVVHRVISVKPQSIKTRGDNNKGSDPWILQPDDIIGRVLFVQRGKRTKWIFGGLRGRIVALSHRVKKLIKKKIVRAIHPTYSYLVKSGYFRYLGNHLVKTRVIFFRQPEGSELQLLLGRRVIGRRLPGERYWRLRPPFNLFVDKDSLPDKLTNGKSN